MSVHYAFGQQRNNKEKEVVSIVDSTEGAEATSIENSNPYVSLVTELSPEDNGRWRPQSRADSNRKPHISM